MKASELEEMIDESKEIWNKLYPNLRSDQVKALAAYAEIIHVIIESKEPIAVAMLWIGEKDLLQDAPITWISNLKSKDLMKIMQHGVARMQKKSTNN